MNDSLRKAAILVDSLDLHAADALLDQMGSDSAARVREAVISLGDVPAHVRDQVIEEFLRGGAAPLPGEDAGGIELDESLARKIAQGPVDSLSRRGEPVADEAPPFQFLHEATGDALCRVLQREHPQTVAVVAAHLPPERAADLLKRLAPGLQADVLRRIANLDETDPQILREVEREIESLFCRQLHTVRQKAVGLSAVRAILQAAASPDREGMLQQLQAADRPLVEQLQQQAAPPRAPAARRAQAAPPRPAIPRASAPTLPPPPSRPPATPASQAPPQQQPCTFHDVERLDDGALAIVVQQADPQVALLALTGARRELVERIMSQLPPRQAKSLQRSMERLGPLRLSDVEQAQRQLAELVGTLTEQGTIRLPTPRRFAVAA